VGLVLLSGCTLFHGLFHGFAADCHKPQEYQRAAQVPPLKVPQGLDSPNTQGALVIPTVELAPPPPGAHDACLDQPPRYKPAPTNKAGYPAS
jgi:uncharacterized lipoprotein